MIYLYHVNIFSYHECVEQLTIGRTTGDIVCADDGRMSGKHAQVSLQDTPEGVIILVEDLGSKNRTVLNRSEIPPMQRIQVKVNSLLEVGNQQFIITNNPKLSIGDINEIMDLFSKRAVTKLEAKGIVPESRSVKPVEVQEEPQETDGLTQREQKVLQTQKDILTLEQNFKQEMQKIEEMKEKLFAQAKAKKEDLTKRLNAQKADLADYKAKFQKMKDEVEQKKKKLINLKDLPQEEEAEIVPELPKQKAN